MSPGLPGTWLLDVLAQWLDEPTVQRLLAPTVADLQYEVRRAGDNPWRRGVALLRGYVALVRLLAVHSVPWRSPMRRLLAILILGAAGTASLLSVKHVTTIGPAQVAPYFVMALFAPAILRALGLGRTYRQMFVNCLLVGLTMATAHYGWLAIVAPAPSLPWFGHAWRMAFLMSSVVFVSGIAAAVAWKPPAGSEPAYHHYLVCLAAGGAAFVCAYSGVGLWFAKDATRLAALLSWAAFLGFFFVVVSGAIHLPILLGARRLLNGRAAVALAGALLFPVPMLGFPFLQGRLASTWAYWLREPTTLIANSLPFIVAGAVLGWLLTERRPQPTAVLE
jgi:hypothetical protein